MKTVIKGIDFTEVITRNKHDIFMETVQHWQLPKPRKKEDCGVWVNGKKVEELDKE